MRLRARAADVGSGAETIRLQVPSSATLYDLRNALSEAIGVAAASIRVSLNKRDEIEGDEAAPLAVCGICPGDLIYYFTATTTTTTTTEYNPPLASPVSLGHSLVQTGDDVETRRQLCAYAADKRAYSTDGSAPQVAYSTDHGSTMVEPLGAYSPDHGSTVVTPQGAGTSTTGGEPGSASTLGSTSSSVDQEAGSSSRTSTPEEEHMEVDGIVDPERFRSHIPSLLSRLLVQESDNLNDDQAFLVLALHGVMLEMGFIGDLSWESSGLLLLRYTLPDLDAGVTMVTIHCQTMGLFVVLYGTVTGSTQVFRLALSVSDFLRRSGSGSGGDNKLSRFRDVFALWKEIKDKLTLPLLMLVCERAGLPLPANFQLLPTEIKMKILEALPPVSLAAAACVNSELRFLASSEPLWRAKYLAEFNGRGDANKANWKLAFATEWIRRRRPIGRRRWLNRNNVFPYPYHFRRPNRPVNPPGIVGGDYDMFPFGGGGPPVGSLPRPNFFPSFRRAASGGAASSGITSSLMFLEPGDTMDLDDV